MFAFFLFCFGYVFAVEEVGFGVARVGVIVENHVRLVCGYEWMIWNGQMPSRASVIANEEREPVVEMYIIVKMPSMMSMTVCALHTSIEKAVPWVSDIP